MSSPASNLASNSLALLFFITFNLVLTRATNEDNSDAIPKTGEERRIDNPAAPWFAKRYRRFPRLVRIRLDASPFNENDDKSALRPERRDERLTALVPPAPPRGGARR
jgi:hypothetical protein